MTLTLGHGPLSMRPAPTNYTIDGPAHRIFVEDTPKRVRVEFAGEVVADTRNAKLLHESNILPRYYVPEEDVRTDLLEDTETTTHCPFKGDATYRSVRVGDRVAEDAVWTYREPVDALPVLKGLVSFYLERMDAVYEEDERLLGHPHDPYHRVDVQRSSRHVRVLHRDGDVGETVLADTTRPRAVFETGLPPVWYVPREDVAVDRLVDSDTTTVCPYKGVATYVSVRGEDGGVAVTDAGWSYEDPLPEATGLPGHVAFAGDGIVVEVDGEVVQGG